MSDAQLARCPRCKAHTLVAERQGIRIALDIAPADATGFGLAVASGVELYWVRKTPGRPLSVPGRYSGTPRPSWAPGGAQAGAEQLHVEHSCGAPAKDQVILNVQRPQSAPATPGSPRGGLHQPDAPASSTRGQERPSPATSATRRPSRPPMCGVCDRLIASGESHWAIENPPGIYVYAEHEECP